MRLCLGVGDGVGTLSVHALSRCSITLYTTVERCVLLMLYAAATDINNNAAKMQGKLAEAGNERCCL